MGRDKERWALGLSHVEGSVCAECVGDAGLAALVEQAASESACDFCGREGDRIAAALDDVVDYMEECISREYEDPANSVGWCSEDGGSLPTLSTDDLLEEIGIEFPNDQDGTLLEAVTEGLGGVSRAWVRRNPYSLPPEDVDYHSWEHFTRVVKHERRFFFLDSRDRDNGLMSPGELLRKISTLSILHGLVRSIPAGTRFLRVRKARSPQVLRTALDLGPPPPEAIVAFATRMSPAGIPMFYACDDIETAACEVWDGPGTYVAGCFEATRNLAILDFTEIPRIPSIFEAASDTAESDPHYDLLFLHNFAVEVSKPIDRLNEAHVEYVPTQVVSEYWRNVDLADGRRVDGIKYRSVQRPGHNCYALYARQEQIIPSEEDVERMQAAGEGFHLIGHDSAWLRLVWLSPRTFRRRPT